MNKYLSEKAKNIAPYTAGEQPDVQNLIKLNTNENPYPPSHKAVKSIMECTNETLRLYPKIDGGEFRKAAAQFEAVSTENIFCANGSDELLAFSFAAFFDKNKKIKMPEISYSFFPVWADLYDIPYELMPLRKDFSIDPRSMFDSEGGVIFPNPNAPTGLALPAGEIEEIVLNNKEKVVIIDEAYSAFGAEKSTTLALKYDNVLVAKTLSKSHALAGLRLGYAIGSKYLIEGLTRIRDSFNSYPIDRLAQAGGAAALLDNKYYEMITELIIKTRRRIIPLLEDIGFIVPPSLANFIFISHPKMQAKELQRKLRDKNILVRRFDNPLIDDWLRVTIGTDEQMNIFIDEAKKALNS